MKKIRLVVFASAAAGLLLTFFAVVALMRVFPLADWRPGPIRHGVSFLFAMQTNLLTGAAADEKDLAYGVEALRRRADKLGRKFDVHADGNNIRVVLSFTSDADVANARKVLTKGGLLEFRLVHEDSARLIQEDLIPPGYTVMKELRAGPSGEKSAVSLLINKKRVKDISGRNINNASVVRGNLNEPQIAFRFDAEGTRAFAKLTTDNIGKQIAIILDGELYSAPMIRSPITEGSGVISGGSMTEKDLWDLAAVLESPLEVSVQIIEERRF